MQSVVYDSTASIEQLLAKGFKLPIHFVAMDANGSIVAGKIFCSGGDRALDCEMTIPPEVNGLATPVNIMYVDRQGHAALVAVGPKHERNSA